ncbi:uncharacterized protein PFL1_06403 [Pseudozyma flocculosa PF-1]|uniref:Extracellular membrane protein CFEM domain-containing protein n=2 Tax=Pseudozyma flocculosa TaxID=84751 RepID=A0A5C3EVH7_9BASI|nr:uncharacterized protein PFL1_06403 [Pseudozyma flocculosa PF-1]EPQ25948.1 hypothetical protein PFL1_06403 [Pseudozyma flocculosa PF-1]SPO35755.1 uncharacterized protein PSFLO_01226 [Pseudozyma flocculosa]
MKWHHLALLLALLLVSLLSSSASASASASDPHHAPHLVARQAPVPAPASASASTSASASSSAGAPASTASAGSAAGGDATVSADTNQGSCQMTNKLSVNQQASWSNGIINTCCVYATYSTCYLRIQSTVSGAEACEIPDCNDLASNDRAKMIGFNALNSTNGQGSLGNIYPSFGQGNGARRQGTARLVVSLVAAVAVSGLALVV